LTNPQVIHTADILDIAAIIMGAEKGLPGNHPTCKRNQNSGSFNKIHSFETAGRLYERALGVV